VCVCVFAFVCVCVYLQHAHHSLMVLCVDKQEGKGRDVGVGACGWIENGIGAHRRDHVLRRALHHQCQALNGVGRGRVRLELLQ